MDVKKLSLYEEIKLITESGAKSVYHRWELTVHAGTEDVSPLFITGIEKECNFLTNHFDVFSVEATFPLGQFNYYIVPNKTKLKVTLKRYPLSENVISVKDNQTAIDSFTYYATLYKDKSGLLEMANPAVNDINKADRTDIISVRLQLIEPIVKILRTVTIGGIYHNTTGINLIRYLLTKYGKEASADSASSVKGCTIAPNANTEIRANILVPHKTRFIDLPYLIHRTAGGIYSAGFHYYLQNSQWFVYAPFNVTAYENTKKGLTVINVPANRFPDPERSFRTTNSQVIVLATGETSHNDFTESSQQNTGNGITFIDANKVFNGYVEISNNGATVNKKDNVSEVLSEKRDDGVNNIMESSDRITASTLVEFSKLAQKNGAFIQAVWENSDPSLLYPGMPVKYMYVESNISQELYGILVGAHTVSTSSVKGQGNRKFNTKTTLTLFVQRKVKIGL